MSKQSDAKAAQGYVSKAIPRTCVQCKHFALDSVPRKSQWNDETYFDEKNLRCNLGGFAVKKMATCNQFAPKIAAV